MACRKEAHKAVQLVYQGAEDAGRRAGHLLTRLSWKHALKYSLSSIFYNFIDHDTNSLSLPASDKEGEVNKQRMAREA